MKYFILLIGFLFLLSCDKQPEKDDAYLVFGHFYGECLGEECVEIYKIENEQLFEDKNDNYPNQTMFNEGDYVSLSKEKFDLVKDLKDAFPEKLLLENETVLGQPDAGDWGGLYIEYNFDGKKRFWLLDQMKTNMDEYLSDFVDEVNLKILLINSDIKTAKGKITGPDYRKCLCCGGWLIEIDGNSHYFWELPKDSNTDLQNVTFPVAVDIQYIDGLSCMSSRIILTKIEVD